VAEPEPGRFRRYTVKRAEKQEAMARQTWPEFLRDLGIRFLIAGGVVLAVLAFLWLLRLVSR
jgi:hypothetical protein